MTITADMIRHCRSVNQGIIVATTEGAPEVRSSVRYDEPDPLHDGSGRQIRVLLADDLSELSDEDVTDEQIAKDLSERWPDLLRAARERFEAIGTAELWFCIDADCPNCGWAERRFSADRNVFGCSKCDYESTDRNA